MQSSMMGAAATLITGIDQKLLPQVATLKGGEYGSKEIITLWI